MSALTEQNRLKRNMIEKRLESLPGWSLDSDGSNLNRRFVFEDFVSAFGFMTQVALIAERMGHHPEWTNVWNRVDVALTTHSAKGVTGRDIELAQKMGAIADLYPLQCEIGGDDCGGCG